MTNRSYGKLGRFVRFRQRRDGTHEVFLSVPPRFQPEGWPPTIHLPQINHRARRYSLDDPDFRSRVIAEAEALNHDLD